RAPTARGRKLPDEAGGGTSRAASENFEVGDDPTHVLTSNLDYRCSKVEVVRLTKQSHKRTVAIQDERLIEQGVRRDRNIPKVRRSDGRSHLDALQLLAKLGDVLKPNAPVLGIVTDSLDSAADSPALLMPRRVVS